MDKNKLIKVLHAIEDNCALTCTLVYKLGPDIVDLHNLIANIEKELDKLKSEV